ncbi:hypothetical protein BJY04DRAFT_213620 [Aspergillus karnatakaensis]|uniref:uncharacterized protein n=1 Tax=Aspergillus karnatakaensis TaxID=1810916 RepID=UPI003CCE47CD
MHFPQAPWLLAAAIGTAVNAVSVVEVDLVFPRNETYAPTEDFPVVFAIQNSAKAELLNLVLSYSIMGADNFSERLLPTTPLWPDLMHTNLSISDPYLVYRFNDALKPGHWLLTGQLDYQSCDVEALTNPIQPVSGGIHSSVYRWSRMFTIANSTSAPHSEVDLVAATKESDCPGDLNAHAINVTDTTMEADPSLNNARRTTCVVTTNSTSGTPVHTPNPCGVSISPEMAASISANLTAHRCNRSNPPDNCPVDENAAQGLVILGVSGLFALCGALVLIIMQTS